MKLTAETLVATYDKEPKLYIICFSISLTYFIFLTTAWIVICLYVSSFWLEYKCNESRDSCLFCIMLHLQCLEQCLVHKIFLEMSKWMTQISTSFHFLSSKNLLSLFPPENTICVFFVVAYFIYLLLLLLFLWGGSLEREDISGYALTALLNQNVLILDFDPQEVHWE